MNTKQTTHKLIQLLSQLSELKDIPLKLQMPMEGLIKNIEESLIPQLYMNQIERCVVGSSDTSLQNTCLSVFGFQPSVEQLQLLDIIAQLKQDLVVLLQTGAGKSLLYQIQPFIKPKSLCLVIQPLCALVQQQHDAVQQLGVQCINLSSLNPQKKKHLELQLHDCQILFATPESYIEAIKQTEVQAFLTSHIDCIFIDECHYLVTKSLFRPALIKVADNIRAHFQIPLVFLSGTLPQVLVRKLAKSFRTDTFQVFRDVKPRDNLHFFIKEVSIKGKDALLLAIIQQYQKNLLLYCTTFKEANRVEAYLVENGIQCKFYHGQLKPVVQAQILEDWFGDCIPVLIATSALGMGINKRNIHIVIHYQLPQNIVDYYQECSRGGRDQQETLCLLFYSKKDVKVAKMFSYREQNLQIFYQLMQLIKIHSCRRKFLHEFLFQSVIDQCDKCDNCILNNSKIFQTKSTDKFHSDIIQTISDSTTSICKLSGKLRKDEAFSQLTSNSIEFLIYQALEQETLYETLCLHPYPYFTLAYNKEQPGATYVDLPAQKTRNLTAKQMLQYFSFLQCVPTRRYLKKAQKLGKFWDKECLQRQVQCSDTGQAQENFFAVKGCTQQHITYAKKKKFSFL